jgi:hypothetical protein
MAKIETRIDRKRGCGWRQPGGLYLVADGPASPCGRLPIPLSTCPTCGHGIAPARGWTWVDGTALIAPHPCDPPAGASCTAHCPLFLDPGKVGLLWIGEQYYPTPRDFLDEADRLGISRRIPRLPAGFKLGRTWVWLVHRKAIPRRCEWCLGQSAKCSHCGGRGRAHSAGVFRAFRPTAVEYVVRDTETEEELDRLVARGITPVRVVRDRAEPSSLLDFHPSEN